ncbi:3-deoxy-D-manno-octulosonic acid transferase [Paracoccus tegillarcae]|uniref:3-deoxy-D-manno-octulosonic acid transferase n=1 Tax=Paracoccus tegillarcae TaxID=1529068 RepID=A0A2K9EW84_9RHOB|nr:glycosyltransferase N-terminal domain-containing protein [Paracoccus tegillarcae]AUH35186.1 3-deoxy-D-manno-octulosonic acid transferase [Paracoccus tegillarcae]
MILAATTRLAETLLRWRTLFGGAGKLRKRMLLDGQPGRADIWVHAASVGELNSAAMLIETLAARHTLLVTTNSETGLERARAAGWNAALAPLDLPDTLARFLNAVSPRVAVTVEAELWPLRAKLLAARRVPHLIVGARMSERSARRWSRLPGLIGPVLRNVTALSAQNGDSETRLLALGLPRSALLPRLDLKLLAPARVTAPPASEMRDRTILAASTHPGEDEPILDAFLALQARRPDLRLILAPRHPDRADQLATAIRARGIAFAQRSGGANDGPLLLADTLGEMPLWYGRAGICLTGGSLVDHGGHTPWEPAAHGCAILHGPHVSNHAEPYAALEQAGGARVTDATSLPAVLSELLAAPDQARRMGQIARGVLDEQAGDPAPLLDLITGLAQKAPDTDI